MCYIKDYEMVLVLAPFIVLIQNIYDILINIVISGNKGWYQDEIKK
jgi:hypothetical protein